MSTEQARSEAARKATTAAGRLEYHLLDGESVTFYPYWAADLRAVIAQARKVEYLLSDEAVERAAREVAQHEEVYDENLDRMVCACGDDYTEGLMPEHIARAALSTALGTSADPS